MEWLGKPLAEILDAASLTLLKQGIARGDFKRLNPIQAIVQEQTFNLVAHFSKNLLILELEQRNPVVSSVSFLQIMDDAIQAIQHTQSIPELVQNVAREVRRLTDFDRVMIYEFDEDYNGAVVAEEKIATLEPFLGLHYPASDIPKQARDLYLKNKIRIIPDIQAQPTRIVPSLSPIDDAPIDLSFSVARGVSPIHIEYLSNMKVGASMSVAIHIDDRLWGLIACHHSSPKFVEYRVRDMIRFLGKLFRDTYLYKQCKPLGLLL